MSGLRKRFRRLSEEMRLRASRGTPFVISSSSIEASCRSFKLDLPFCSNRLLNLPLIPRLSRFFTFFFHPFVFFVSPLRCASSILLFLLLLLLPPSLHLRSPLFVVAPFLYTYLPASRPFTGSLRRREICADRFRTVSYLMGSCFGAKSSRGVCFFVLTFPLEHFRH